MIGVGLIRFLVMRKRVVARAMTIVKGRDEDGYDEVGLLYRIPLVPSTYLPPCGKWWILSPVCGRVLRVRV